jgi:hypothetical protein
MSQHAEERLLGEVVADARGRGDSRAERSNRLVMTAEEYVERGELSVPKGEHEFFVRRSGHQAPLRARALVG